MLQTSNLAVLLIFFLLFLFLVLTKCQVLNLTVGRSCDQVLQIAYWTEIIANECDSLVGKEVACRCGGHEFEYVDETVFFCRLLIRSIFQSNDLPRKALSQVKHIPHKGKFKTDRQTDGQTDTKPH